MKTLILALMVLAPVCFGSDTAAPLSGGNHAALPPEPLRYALLRPHKSSNPTLININSIAPAKRTPAEWVRQLGSGQLAERDEAWMALLMLGSKAYKDVFNALHSSNAQVRQSATELWSTLRWLPIPDADDEVRELVAEAKQGNVNHSRWRKLVQSHNGKCLLLVAELCRDNIKVSITREILHIVLEFAQPADITKVLAESGVMPANMKNSLDGFAPGGIGNTDAPDANYMQLEIAFSNFKKAFDFGREAYYWNEGENVRHACVVAATLGNFSDHVEETAHGDITGETNQERLRRKIELFAAVYAGLGWKDRTGTLFDLAGFPDTGDLNAYEIKSYIEILTKAGGPACVVKALQHARSGVELCMRSRAERQMHKTAQADTDWQAGLAAFDTTKEERKTAILALAKVLYDWHDHEDNLTEALAKKALEEAPQDSGEDSNALFYIGGLAEEQGKYGRAADFYEKALALAIDAGIEDQIDFSEGPGIIEDAQGEEATRAKIKKLRAQAAAQKGGAMPGDSTHASHALESSAMSGASAK